MSEQPITLTGSPLAVRDDHYCFGCGQMNPYGLHLHFYVNEDGDGVSAPWTPAREHEGFTGISPGGIITTVLDEVMGWALYQRDIWAVTATAWKTRCPAAAAVKAAVRSAQQVSPKLAFSTLAPLTMSPLSVKIAAPTGKFE